MFVDSGGDEVLHGGELWGRSVVCAMDAIGYCLRLALCTAT